MVRVHAPPFPNLPAFLDTYVPSTVPLTGGVICLGAGSGAGSYLVQATNGVELVLGREVRIPERHYQRLMAEQFLDRPEVHALHHEARGCVVDCWMERLCGIIVYCPARSRARMPSKVQDDTSGMGRITDGGGSMASIEQILSEAQRQRVVWDRREAALGKRRCRLNPAAESAYRSIARDGDMARLRAARTLAEERLEELGHTRDAWSFLEIRPALEISTTGFRPVFEIYPDEKGLAYDRTDKKRAKHVNLSSLRKFWRELRSKV